MRTITLLAILVALTLSAYSANRKITVNELRELLHSLQQAKKDDAETATQLKQVELSEQINRATMDSLADEIPGPLSTEQVYILEARSAILPAPAADLPTAPAPDAAAQQAILAKTSDYVSKSYALLPHLSASRVIARFQDGIEAIHGMTGMNNNVSEQSDPVFAQTSLYVRFLGSKTETVESQNGIELPPAVKDKTPWGSNGQFTNLMPGPLLANVWQEASAAGKINFLRWETVNSKPAAVFTFAVDKKKSHYQVNYCCFPETMQAGVLNYAMTPGSGNKTASGNLQTASNWKPFKTGAPYHGEFFLDPESGTVLRLIVQPEFKNTDFVHREDTRIDYMPMPVGSKELVVPIKSFVSAEVVPNGDSYAAKFTVRRIFLTTEYKDYAVAP